MDAPAVAEQARIEHEILKHVTNALQLSLDWETSHVGVPRKLGTVSFIAQCLQRHLEHQMTLEECDGYMSVVLENHPTWSHEIVALKEEHGYFRANINGIMARLQAVAPQDENAFQTVCDELRALLQRLADHGSKEIELLQRAFLHEEVAVD